MNSQIKIDDVEIKFSTHKVYPTHWPAILVDVQFSRGTDVEVVNCFYQDLSAFDSNSFFDSFCKVKKLIKFCLKQQKIIAFSTMEECEDDEKTVECKNECLVLLKEAIQQFINSNISMDTKFYVSVKKHEDVYDLARGGKRKNLFLSNFFNDVSLINDVVYIYNYMWVKRLYGSSISKTSGIVGVRVAKNNNSLQIGGVLKKGETRNGTIMVKGCLRSAFLYAFNAHIESFGLLEPSKDKKNSFYLIMCEMIKKNFPEKILKSISVFKDKPLQEIKSIPVIKKSDKIDKNNYDILLDDLFNKPNKRTNLCGVDFKFTENGAEFVAVIGICSHKGYEYQTFDVGVHGLYESFALALSVHRKSFNLSVLNSLVVEQLFENINKDMETKK